MLWRRDLQKVTRRHLLRIRDPLRQRGPRLRGSAVPVFGECVGLDMDTPKRVAPSFVAARQLKGEASPLDDVCDWSCSRAVRAAGAAV